MGRPLREASRLRLIADATAEEHIEHEASRLRLIAYATAEQHGNEYS